MITSQTVPILKVYTVILSCSNFTPSIYTCKSQFNYIKVGFKGVKIILVCFLDARYSFVARRILRQ